MCKLLTQNSKLKKEGIWSFNLPPMSTCPMAGECKKYCYAKKGFYNMPSVKKGLKKRYLVANTANFADQIGAEIKGKKFVRIHASGDFFSAGYLRQWRMIALSNPNVNFYCYTKSVALFKECANNVPANFRVIFSLGGLQDEMINLERDRHCRIFNTKAELDQAGYTDVSNSDLLAATTSSIKLGIVRH
jgi:hypothetical protein